MRITLVPVDGLVVVNGTPFSLAQIGCPIAFPANASAVQVRDTLGHVEFADGRVHNMLSSSDVELLTQFYEGRLTAPQRIFGFVGSAESVNTYEWAQPEGSILMSGPRPSALHVADASGDWVVSEDLARAERDYRLRCHVDCMNPAWWETLSQEDKDIIQAYRQALLDVPQQLDFPHDINWPRKPELLSGEAGLSR